MKHNTFILVHVFYNPHSEGSSRRIVMDSTPTAAKEQDNILKETKSTFARLPPFA